MKVAWETLAAAVLVAASILFVGRYQISGSDSRETYEHVFRLDRWTGKVDACVDNVGPGAGSIECPENDPAVQRTN